MLSYTFQFKKKVINLVFVSAFRLYRSHSVSKGTRFNCLKKYFHCTQLPYHCCTLQSFFFLRPFSKRTRFTAINQNFRNIVVVGILLSRETMVAPCLVKSVWLRAASGMAQQTYPGVTVLATSEANEIGRLV